MIAAFGTPVAGGKAVNLACCCGLRAFEFHYAIGPSLYKCLNIMEDDPPWPTALEDDKQWPTHEYKSHRRVYFYFFTFLKF
jgi:hypothetical protein